MQLGMNVIPPHRDTV